MIVLGLDASGPGAGAAVVDASGVRGAAWAGPGVRPAAALLPLAERVLAAAGLAREDLDGVAVAIGPGSYAGVRTAVATGKALAWTAGLPLAAVGSLEALACAAGPRPGTVWAALDARRGRVFAAPFRWGAEAPEPEAAPALLSHDAFRRVAVGSASATGVLLAGSGAGPVDLADDAGGARTPPFAAAGAPAAVAWLGRRRLLAGERADPFALAPAYISEPVIGPAPGGPRPPAAARRRRLSDAGTGA